MPDTATPGVWLAASYALRRPIPVDAPYPHICGVAVTGTVTGWQYVVERKECAACHVPRPNATTHFKPAAPDMRPEKAIRCRRPQQAT
jgi:hypothetical protein